jgi:hypothetical protein
MLAGCVAEEMPPAGKGRNDITENKTPVNFSISVPSQPQTRGLTDEDAINTIHVLLFEREQSASMYAYCIRAENISTASGTQRNFQVLLPKGNFDIAVLTNAQDIIARSGIAFGQGKDQVLRALVERNTGKWENSAIPAWGRKDNQVIDSYTEFTGRNAIQMIRMMAKVEVVLTPEAAGTNGSNFVLTDIRLYNYSTQGALAPDLSTWPADNCAVQPTEPAVSGGYATMSHPANPPLLFSGTTVFYTYEAPAGASGAARANNTCLVIGGSYRGGSPTYYRVDFAGGSNPVRYRPLLRNYHYLLQIVKVVGEGYPSPETALETANADMEINILSWNNSNMDSVSFNGQHTLEVSQSSFIFSREGIPNTKIEANKLRVRTNVAGGGTAKIVDPNGVGGISSWLFLSENSSSFAHNVPKDIYLYVMGMPDRITTDRTAYVDLQAGTLTYRVTVTQKPTPGASSTLIITDPRTTFELSGLDFPHAGSPTKQFRVNWTPTSASLTVKVTPVGSAPAFSGTGVPADGETISGGPINEGTKTYSVTAANFTGDPMAERASRIEFTLKDGTSVLSRSIILRQINFTLKAVNPSVFKLDGGVKSIGIRSNTQWTVIDVIDPNGILANSAGLLGRTGGPNTTEQGATFSFGVANRLSNPPAGTPQATLVFQDESGTTYPVVIKGSV